jgi:hypothetical protein
MDISVRDRTALSVALLGGIAFAFFAIEAGAASHHGFLVAVSYVLVFIPATVLLSERLKILVWQASVITFAVCVLAWNLFVQKIDFVRGGAGLSFAQIVFVLWTAVTIFSSPVPLYFGLRRVAPPTRYYLASAVVASVVVLYWALKTLVR